MEGGGRDLAENLTELPNFCTAFALGRLLAWSRNQLTQCIKILQQNKIYNKINYVASEIIVSVHSDHFL